MMHLIRKILKILKFTGKEIFCKITHEFGFRFKHQHRTKICLSFITIIDKSVAFRTSKGHSAIKISHPVCSLPLSSVTFELSIK